MTQGSSEPPRSVQRIWKTRPLFSGVKPTRQRIVFHLFPVLESPKFLFSGGTKFQSEAEIAEACGGPGPLPFLLENGQIHSLSPMTREGAIARALENVSDVRQERFSDWLSSPTRSKMAIELLNRSLRYHGWKRGLRYEGVHELFHFTRSKPKKLLWDLDGKTLEREVTAPHIEWTLAPNESPAEFQCGWKHEAVRAAFILQNGALHLRMEPSRLWTELDGKTPSAQQPAIPIEAGRTLEQENERTLQAARFWSGVLSKGHRELRIETGLNPIRVRLAPTFGAGDSQAEQFRSGPGRLLPNVSSRTQLTPEITHVGS